MEIIIKGFDKSYKSTAAQEIVRYLVSLGARVELSDENDEDSPSVLSRKHACNLLGLIQVSENHPIKVSTQNLSRTESIRIAG